MFIKLLAAVLALLIIVLPQASTAHVLIRDQSGRAGLILHVMPDDDPIAGTATDMFFDVQQVAMTADTRATLSISYDGQAREVAVYRTDGGFRAKHTFPQQGAYQIRLAISTGTEQTIFMADQRVSRGASQAASNTTYLWAEVGLLISGVGGLVVLIVAWNRRRDIIRASRF